MTAPTEKPITSGAGEHAAEAYQNHEPGKYEDAAMNVPVDVRLGLAQRPKAPDPMPFAIKGVGTGGR